MNKDFYSYEYYKNGILFETENENKIISFCKKFGYDEYTAVLNTVDKNEDSGYYKEYITREI